jgi:DNA-binding CsgD family transcriptional regulator/DNA-binding Lrp family transcriptional regulator
MISRGPLRPLAQVSHHAGMPQDDLAPAGITPFDESVYRATVSRRVASPAEIAAELGHSTERVGRSLDRLREQGLVGRLSGTRRRYAAIEPQTALDALVRARTGELEHVRLAAAELSRMFAAAREDGVEEVQIATGGDALARWFVTLQQEARQEVLTLDRPPYALTTSNPVEATALTRGVVYRAVYAPEALEWPGVLNDIRDLVKHGEQARVLPGLRVKVAIADRRLALMPLSLDLTGVRAAIIRPSTLLDAMVDYWELCWRQALPLDAPAAGPADDPLAEEDRQLLTLLVSGLKDDAIARQLGWSVRTMRRRMSRLHELLGASNRFQAGVMATRRGWL